MELEDISLTQRTRKINKMIMIVIEEHATLKNVIEEYVATKKEANRCEG